jgi:hypothetical protein
MPVKYHDYYKTLGVSWSSMPLVLELLDRIAELERKG